MVEISDIVDRESLKGWLQSKPREFSISIAVRAGLRVLPYVWRWDAFESSDEKAYSVLFPLRALLTAYVEAKRPDARSSAAAHQALKTVAVFSELSPNIRGARAASEAANSACWAACAAATKEVLGYELGRFADHKAAQAASRAGPFLVSLRNLVPFSGGLRSNVIVRWVYAMYSLNHCGIRALIRLIGGHSSPTSHIKTSMIGLTIGLSGCVGMTK